MCCFIFPIYRLYDPLCDITARIIPQISSPTQYHCRNTPTQHYITTFITFPCLHSFLTHMQYMDYNGKIGLNIFICVLTFSCLLNILLFEKIKRRSNSTCPIVCPRCTIEKGMIVFHCITLQYLCGFSSLLTDSFCLG